MVTKPVLTALLTFALVLLSACGGDEDGEEMFPGIAAMCEGADGAGCNCTGFLITPQTVVSAAHCGRASWAIFGRTDLTDASSGVAIRIESHCRGLAGDDRCDGLTSTETDLELHFLRDPVPASVTPPLRLGTNADRDHAEALIGAGYGAGNLRGATFPRLSNTCPLRIDTSFPGQNFCFDVGGGLATTGLLTDGDSGGPLYARTSDGEFSVVGMYSGFGAGFEVYQDLEAHADLLPGARRPPFMLPDILEFYPWRRLCETPTLVPINLIVPTSLQVADFNADGTDDVFFEVEQDTPRLLPGPTFAEVKTSNVADVALYPYTIASGRWAQTEGLAAVDRQLRLRTFMLEGAQWTPTPLPSVDLLQHDPLWNVADLDTLDQPNLVTDPLLRPGDLDGDGRTDILAVLSERLVTFENHGDAWAISSQLLEELSIPNEQAYRETITVADVAAAVTGAEVIARYECGLLVFGYEADRGLFEIFRQNCDDDPWAASDEQGYNEHNRWHIATGNLNGDACADVMLRSATRLHQLFSNCDPELPLAFSEGPNPGAAWLEPFGGYTGWGAGDFGGRMLLIDLDGDGLDDLVGNGPDGMQGRGNQNAEEGNLAFGSIGGLDPIITGAVNVLVPIDDWRLVKPGDFGANGRQLIWLNRSQGCLEFIDS